MAVIAYSTVVIFLTNIDAVWYNRSLELFHTLEHIYISKSDSPNAVIPSVEDIPSVEEIYSNDVNVSTRIEENKIALDFFFSQPITGAGLGIRHEMAFQTFEGKLIIQQVGYVHNWITYFLMVGGYLGAFGYGAILLLPSVLVGRGLWPLRKILARDELDYNTMVFCCIWVGFLTLILYSLFFAVFRLITFNLVLAAGIGIAAYMTTKLRKRAQECAELQE